MDLPWFKRNEPLVKIGKHHSLTLHLSSLEQTVRRWSVERFIHDRFVTHYHADIRHFMPWLLSLEDDDGRIQGAAGLREAQNHGLFLERYLDEPIEEVISHINGAAVTRAGIVEVGNLTATGAASARLLIVALTGLLVAQGVQWVAFTGTAMLLNSFNRLAIDLLPLVQADPLRMGDELSEWGSYYASGPWVMAVNVLHTHQALLHQGVYVRMNYQPLCGCKELSDAVCCC